MANFFKFRSGESDPVDCLFSMDMSKSPGITDFNNDSTKLQSVVRRYHHFSTLLSQFKEDHTNVFPPNQVTAKTKEVLTSKKVRLTVCASIEQIAVSASLFSRLHESMLLLSQFGKIPLFIGQSLFYKNGHTFFKAYQSNSHIMCTLDLAGQEYSFTRSRWLALQYCYSVWTSDPVNTRKYFQAKLDVPLVHRSGRVYKREPSNDHYPNHSGCFETYHMNCWDTHLGFNYALARHLYDRLTRLGYKPPGTEHVDGTIPAIPYGLLKRMLGKDDNHVPTYSMGDDLIVKLPKRILHPDYPINLTMEDVYGVMSRAMATGHVYTYEADHPVIAKTEYGDGGVRSYQPLKLLAGLIMPYQDISEYVQRLSSAQINLYNTEYYHIVEELIRDLHPVLNYEHPFRTKGEMEELFGQLTKNPE